MAYYDALIAKWATLNGTTAQKLAAVNALTVASPQKALLTPSAILNAIVPSDLAALTSAQVAMLTLILQGATVDASAGTTIRAAAQNIFSGKATTLANLGALVAPYDNATIPWWQATVAQGGGGLNSSVSNNDLVAAGGLV
jgi:hypothetical protein